MKSLYALEVGDVLKNNQRNRLVSRFILGLVSSFTYLPVIAGILTPMLWLLPAWYSAWYVIGLIFPFSSIWGGLWLPFSSILGPLIIWIIEGIVFFTGLVLFTLALFEMTRKISDGASLVTSGPYSWVRHPQHLGIILFLLPLALFNISSSPYWTGIRPGDILSWSLVSFMLIVAADLEEYTLVKRFGSEYIDYAKQIQFILPRVSLFGFLDKYASLSKGRPLRYVIWFVLYWCIASLILYGFTLLELNWSL
ncbi:MAG: isoprenylcysteine carboxylmethyltransferase family protein [Candidatus Thorarchaeota archaeon]